MSSKLYRIPLEKLVLDNSLKVRAINEDHIERLSNSDPSLWPVLKVVPEDGGNKYYVVSGWHRVNAARQMGLNALDCELVEYIDDDNAKLLAYESNGSHGLPLTVTERKKYASLLREQYPYMQVKDIAKKVNLAPSTVSEHLRDINRPHIKKIKNISRDFSEEITGVSATETINAILQAISKCSIKKVDNALVNSLSQVVTAYIDDQDEQEALVNAIDVIERAIELALKRYYEE